MKIFVLSSLGRAGLNFLSASLDNHPQIIMLACLSFFRQLEMFKIDHSKYFHNFPPKNENIFLKKFLNYLYIKNRFTLEGQFIKNLREKNKLNILLIREFKKQKKGHFYSKLFFALHFAFTKLHGKDIGKKKIIIVYEKNPIFLDNYNKYFQNPKVIMLVKNPLFNFSGTKKASKNNDEYYPSKLNFLYGQINSGLKFIDKNKTKVIKIESLNLNFKKEIKKLTKFMGISFAKTLFKTTFLGRKWGHDSSFVVKGNQKYTTKKVNRSFNLPEHQLKRALSVVDKKEIIMVETIFNKVYLKFKYKKIFKSNFLNFLLGYLYFLSSYKNDKTGSVYLKLKNSMLRILIILLPGNEKYKWLHLN